MLPEDFDQEIYTQIYVCLLYTSSLGLFVGTMMNLGVNAKFDQPTGLYTFHELKKQLPSFIDVYKRQVWT